jgi:hypothetical protein
MANTSTQQRYLEVLMERVREDRYPSHQLLDRIEAALYTPDQVVAYGELLLKKIDESWYPSGQLLNRMQRILAFVAHASTA